MRKKISVFIAVIMLINTFVPFFGDLMAAPLGLKASFTQALTPGLTNSIPVVSYNGITNTQAYVEWPLVDNSGYAAAVGNYKLVYPISNGYVVKFEVKKAQDVAEVTYKLYKNIACNDADELTGAYLPYQINTNLGGGVSQATYVDLALFQNTSDPDYKVLNVPAPTFRIKKDRGFSFKLNQNTVHFLWSGDKMLYTTDGVTPGNLYDFNLYFSSGSTYNATSDDKVTVFNGLNVNTFLATPSALTKTGTNAYTDITKPLSDVANVLDFELNSTSFYPPATPDNNIHMTVDLPKKWNTATNSFSTTITKNGAGDIENLQMVFNIMNNVKESQIRQFTLSNIFDPAITIQSSNQSTIKARLNAGKDKLEIVLEKLEPGMIFNDSKVSLVSSDTSIYCKTTTLPVDKIYTFLKYEVVYQDGQFFALVKPYEGYEGYYMLHSGQGPTEDGREPSSTKPSDGKSDLLLPLKLSAIGGTSKYLQIIFNRRDPFPNDQPAPGSIRSQIMKYKATGDKITVGTPNNFTILESTLTPFAPAAGTDWTHQADLKLKLRWDIASVNDIKAMFAARSENQMTIYYDLQNTLSPSNTTKSIFGNVAYTIREVVDPNDAGKTILMGDYVLTVFDNDGTVRDVVTVSNFKINDYAYPENDTLFIARAFVDLDLKAYDGKINTKYMYKYPNIYFLNVKASQIAYQSAVPVDVSIPESLFDSLTLSDLSELELPPPQNVTATNPITTEPDQEISFQLKYLIPGSKIKEYIDNSFPYDGYDVKYNVYITQDENKLKTILAKEGAARGDGLPSISYSSGGTLFMSAINGNAGLVASKPDGTNKEALQFLRDGEVVKIGDIAVDGSVIASGSNVDKIFKIDGLDKNQKYYVAVDSYIVFKHMGEAFAPEFSKVSNIAAVTTIGDFTTPGPGEKYPAAPVLNKENVSLAAATVYWDAIKDLEPAAKIEYEMVRVKDKAMDSALLDTRGDFEAFIAKAPVGGTAVGLRSDGSTINKYDGKNKTPIMDGTFVYTPDTVVKLTDNTLTPNSLYFYYVRTVRIVNGQENYSTWSAISVTTTPVKPPENLKIERELTIEYNTETQMIISFDAPFADLSRLGKDYVLQVSAKQDNGAWGEAVTMDSAKLIERATKSNMDGYYHFIYVMTNLKSGTEYSFRVRLYDNINSDASAYSNIATSRTETSQIDYDKEKDKEELLDYLRELLMEAVKDNYWLAENSGTDFIPVYRPGMADNVLSSTTGSMIVLPTDTTGKNTYYIPSSLLLAANLQNKGFTVKYRDMEVVIPPNAINTNENEAVLRAAERIKNKNVKDYYLRVTLEFIVPVAYTQIDGYEPAGQQVKVTLEIVESKKSIKQWDDEILSMLEKRIAEKYYVGKAESNILSMLGKEESKEVILKEMFSMVEDIKGRMSADIYNSLNTTLDMKYEIVQVNPAISIKVNNVAEDETTNGFMYVGGSWIRKEVTNLGSSRVMYTNTAGSFIFNRFKAYFAGLDQLQNSADMSAIIANYGLDDYFGKGDAFNINAPATSYMVSGVVARLAGAEKGADPVAWLRQKGYNVSSRGTTTSANMQETLYQVMALYEMKTNTKIASLKISNYNITNGITGIDSKYLKSIQAAFEMGIYSNKNMKVNDTPTVKNVIEMLNALNQKVKL